MKQPSTFIGAIFIASFIFSACANKRDDAANTKNETSISNDHQLSQEAALPELTTMKEIFNSIPDIIFYKDTMGVYIMGNKAWADLVGRPYDSIVGKTDFELFPKEVAESFRQKDREMMQSGQKKTNDEWVDYPDKRHVLLNTLKAPVYDKAGNIIGVVGIARDITARKN